MSGLFLALIALVVMPFLAKATPRGRATIAGERGPSERERAYWNAAAARGDHRPWREVVAEMHALRAMPEISTPVESLPTPAATVTETAPCTPTAAPVAPPLQSSPDPEDYAPPFTGCKDHPVTRSGYCTRCADLEDAE